MKWWTIILIIAVIAALVMWQDSMAMKSQKPKLYKVPWLPDGKKAITLAPFGVLILPDSIKDKNVIKHEQCHWKQYQDMRLVPYYQQYWKQLDEHGYNDHPMEIACRQNGGEL